MKNLTCAGIDAKRTGRDILLSDYVCNDWRMGCGIPSNYNHIKLNKMEETLKNNETAQFGIGAVSSSFYSDGNNYSHLEVNSDPVSRT